MRFTEVPPTPRSADDWLHEASDVLDSTRGKTFDRAAEARFNACFKLSQAARAGELRVGLNGVFPSISEIFAKARMEKQLRALDPATIEFFSGKRQSELHQSKTISVRGGRIEERASSRMNGRVVGPVTELRDFSALFEERTYSGLAEGAGASGGYATPIGFIPTVIAALKRTDEILEASNWDLAATEDGRPINLPSLTDTATSAITVAEAAAQTFVNPTFGQVLNTAAAFDQCTTWTSQVVKASVQLEQDAVPALIAILADAFRIRFARGFGASVVSTVLSDAPVGFTTTASAITQDDLLDLMDAVDPQYAASEGAAWVMNWKTFLAIVKSTLSTASGEAAFLLRTDGRGHYLLFERPVFISPSMDNIALGKSPVMFGDFSRLIIRNVPSEAVIRRYDELFAANAQKGYEMLFRADGQILHAGGSGDDPIQVLAIGS